MFLEKWDAEGALEDGLEQRVDVIDLFLPVAAVEVGMDEIADDGAGANEGNLDSDVVEDFWLHARERGHLGAALDLENADGVGFLHHFKSGRVVHGEFCEIKFARGAALFAHLDGVLHGGHHAEP